MKHISFDLIPAKVQELHEKMDNMTRILESLAPTNNKLNSDLLDINEAAKILNLAKPTIYNKVSNLEIPVMKRGNRLYFSRKELTNYILEGKILSKGEIENKTENLFNPKKI